MAKTKLNVTDLFYNMKKAVEIDSKELPMPELIGCGYYLKDEDDPFTWIYKGDIAIPEDYTGQSLYIAEDGGIVLEYYIEGEIARHLELYPDFISVSAEGHSVNINSEEITIDGQPIGSGGTKLYKHNINFTYEGDPHVLYFISTDNTPATSGTLGNFIPLGGEGVSGSGVVGAKLIALFNDNPMFIFPNRSITEVNTSFGTFNDVVTEL